MGIPAFEQVTVTLEVTVTSGQNETSTDPSKSLARLRCYGKFMPTLQGFDWLRDHPAL
jgi:hypothetical protein